MTRLTAILRYPLKSHGRETLDSVALQAGQSIPFDRQWAVAHEGSRATGTAWSPCQQFVRVAGAPQLAAITSKLDEAANTLTLRHPACPPLTFNPDTEADAFLRWVKPLVPQHRAQPARVVRLAGHRGFTDSAFPSVTLCNLASHRAVEEKAGRTLSTDRWRGNFWFDTGTAWEEFDWIGRDIEIGGAKLRVTERTERCMTTAANPETGERDADILGVLEQLGHQDFSVLAEVVSPGVVALEDEARLL